MKRKPSGNFDVEPRLRVRLGDEIALGPGKVELLGRIQQTGSITEAARRHNGRMNGLFYDTHVQAFRTGELHLRNFREAGSLPIIDTFPGE
jgi:prepilin-type processing-associated H-X9-DG protein